LWDLASLYMALLEFGSKITPVMILPVVLFQEEPGEVLNNGQKTLDTTFQKCYYWIRQSQSGPGRCRNHPPSPDSRPLHGTVGHELAQLYHSRGLCTSPWDQPGGPSFSRRAAFLVRSPRRPYSPATRWPTISPTAKGWAGAGSEPRPLRPRVARRSLVYGNSLPSGGSPGSWWNRWPGFYSGRSCSWH